MATLRSSTDGVGTTRCRSCMKVPMKLVAVVSVSANGQTLRSASETLTDLDYLDHIADVCASEPLVHEKRLLDDWLRARFTEARPAS